LRGKPKIYLTDAAIGPSVMLKGKALLEDEAALGKAVETAFFKHVFTRYYSRSIGFSYWRGKGDLEVDIIADQGDRLVPFEVKYRAPRSTGIGELQGMVEFCGQHQVAQGYVITRELTDFQVLSVDPGEGALKLLKIPAPLACFWLGKSELEMVR
jgi:predicted AAA+ superfamily ATPase